MTSPDAKGAISDDKNRIVRNSDFRIFDTLYLCRPSAYASSSHLNDTILGHIQTMQKSNKNIPTGVSGEKMGWWDNQHGKQLRISAIGTFAFGLLTFMTLVQLLFLQDNADFSEYTSASIVLIVIGAIGLAFAAPAFLSLQAEVNVIKSIMDTESLSEIRKMKGDGDEAARRLGGSHEEAWNAFLKEKGLKKR